MHEKDTEIGNSVMKDDAYVHLRIYVCMYSSTIL